MNTVCHEDELFIAQELDDQHNGRDLGQEIYRGYLMGIDLKLEKLLPDEIYDDPEAFEKSDWKLSRLVPIHIDEVIEKTILTDPEGEKHELAVITLG